MGIVNLKNTFTVTSSDAVWMCMTAVYPAQMIFLYSKIATYKFTEDKNNVKYSV
jgi:hypothetical protein